MFTTQQKRKDILLLLESLSSLRGNEIPAETVLALCNWSMERFDDLKENLLFVNLYKYLIQLEEQIESKEQMGLAERKQCTQALFSGIVSMEQTILKLITCRVYIQNIKDRAIFQEDNTEIYLYDPMRLEELEAADREDVFRILYSDDIVPASLATSVDYVITSRMIQEYVLRCYPIDLFSYDRLYLSGKLQQLEKQETKIWISGASATMCGLTESLMPRPALNSATNVQDLYYSILSARKAIELCPKIDTVVLTLLYFSFCWEITDNPSDFSLSEVSRVNFPIFQECRGYTGPLKPMHSKPQIKNPLMHHVCDMVLNRERIFNEISAKVGTLEYYNRQFHPRPATGAMLNYHF